MKKLILTAFLLLTSIAVFAEPNTVTPLEKISTSKKDFQLGNSYKFKNVNTGEIYTGLVTYYRPNGMMGQEAQIEISQFTDLKNNLIPGRITIIPSNHKAFQEFMNYFTMSAFAFIRGSEIVLEPEVHKFVLNNSVLDNSCIIIIKPTESVSTCNDELEYSDVVEFEVVKNVYKKSNLYIKSGTKIYGIIDMLDENGWCADNAAIYFKEFKTKDVNGKKISIKADLMIDGFEILKFKAGRTKQFFNYISTFIRGKEVDIRPEDTDIQFVLVTK